MLVSAVSLLSLTLDGDDDAFLEPTRAFTDFDGGTSEKTASNCTAAVQYLERLSPFDRSNFVHSRLMRARVTADGFTGGGQAGDRLSVVGRWCRRRHGSVASRRQMSFGSVAIADNGI